MQAFKEGRVHARDIALFVEGFELLDDSPFGAVRGGDLVCVNMISHGGVEVLKGGSRWSWMVDLNVCFISIVLVESLVES